MQANKIFHKFVGFLLLLLLLQKNGGELLFHDFVHEAPSKTASLHHFDGDGHQHIALQCSCFSDFVLPGQSVCSIALPASPLIYLCCISLRFVQPSFLQPVLHSLFRGPPMMVAPTIG